MKWRLRHADEWVGLLVLAALALLGAAIFQAGVLRDLLRPTSELRVLLPDDGISGLSVGAELEVLGIAAGRVRRIVITPGQRLFAEVEVNRDATEFIRRDSTATIRRRFGVAGAAYLDVSRGVGQTLDWNFAVIESTSERPPTETVGALIDEARGRIFPILDDLQRATGSLANAMQRLERGEGALGRLLADDTLTTQAEGVIAEARAMAATIGRTLQRVEQVATNTERLSATLSGPQGVPQVLRRVEAVLADVQRMTRDLQRATPRAGSIARNVDEASANLAPLLLQAQTTTRELEALVEQLRGLWLLGGGGPLPEQGRLPAERIRP